MIEAAKAELPELPLQREQRFIDLGVEPGAARTLSWRPELGDLFEAALATDGSQPKALAALITNELLKRIGDGEVSDTSASPQSLASSSRSSLPAPSRAPAPAPSSIACTRAGETRRRSSRPRASPPWVAATNSRRSSRPRSTPTPTSPRSEDRRHEADRRRDRRLRHERDQGPRDGKEVTKVTRQLLGL